jgi:two-component system sensor histidine kinase DegS
LTTSSDPLGERLAAETRRAETELAEIDLLIGQARTEAGRHEARRAGALEKLLAGQAAGTPPDEASLVQLATLTKRAAFIEAQVDVLEAKRKGLARLRDLANGLVDLLRAPVGGPAAEAGGSGSEVASGTVALAEMPASHARLVASAQEDLRREIARAMHDGPAQSLTNIVLQARIVERLLARDPAAATAEAAQLVAMVQHTLEATKSFIFDVRPMVLDDLGLVATLRRAARERGQRAGVAVDFESIGADQRLPVDLESGLFRTLDEALAAFLAAGPERVTLVLDWSDELTASVTAARPPAVVPDPDLPAAGTDTDLPPALAEMVERRREAHAEAVEAARRAAVVTLPANVAREATARAAVLGYAAAVSPEGDRLTLRVPLAGPGPA